MAKVAGRAIFRIDGIQYKLRGNMNISLGDKEREGVFGLDGPHGYKETSKTCFIEGDFTDDPAIDFNALVKMVDVTIDVELESGKKGVLANAWCATAPVLNVDDGKYSLRFEGNKGQWIVAQETAVQRAS